MSAVPPHRHAYRPAVMGRRGAVTSAHPLASMAGIEVLLEGGNAVDAAVAVASSLNVVEPFMSGLGGDGFYHVFVRQMGEALVFNGTGPAPRAATPERYAAGTCKCSPPSSIWATIPSRRPRCRVGRAPSPARRRTTPTSARTP